MNVVSQCLSSLQSATLQGLLHLLPPAATWLSPDWQKVNKRLEDKVSPHDLESL